LEPPSSILDDYFSVGISFLLSLAVYALISGISHSFSFIKESTSTDDSKRAGHVAHFISNPFTVYGTVYQFSVITRLLIVFLCVRVIDSVFMAALLAVVIIYSVSEAVRMAIKGREARFFHSTSFFTLVLSALAMPYNRLLASFTVRLEERMEERDVQSIEEITEDEANDSLEDYQERTLLRNIVALSNKSVYDIMIPRVEVEALNTSMSTADVMDIAIKCGYSRLPVYDSDMDNIKGFLYIKDLVNYLKEKRSDYDWKQHVREAYFVPGNKKINDLLEEFREKKIHLALVVDEYGGTDGIVTLEDVLEEIIGEITDESDILNTNK
jgi:putative hemolysin